MPNSGKNLNMQRPVAARRIWKFIFPDVNRFFLLRLAAITVTAFFVFRFILIPFRVSGYSMDPTYPDGAFNFCFTLRYLVSEPDASDVVLIRMAGSRVMLLKRVVATEGQTVAFENGRLIVDDQPVFEPYIGRAQDWNLEPRKVRSGHIYVIGDNRNVPMWQHYFGQTPVERIAGVPLW